MKIKISEKKKNVKSSLKPTAKAKSLFFEEEIDIDKEEEEFLNSKALKQPPRLKMQVKKNRSKRRKILIATALIFTFFLTVLSILSYFYVYAPIVRVRNSVEIIKLNSKEIADGFEKKDLRNLDTNITNVRTELDNIDKELMRYDFLKNFGKTKGYYENLQITRNVIAKTDVLLQETLPDLENVLSATGFIVDDATLPNTTEQIENNGIVSEAEIVESTDESTEDEVTALNLILKELPQYLALYEDSEPKIIEIFNEIEKIDPEYVPSVGSINFEERLLNFNRFADSFPQTSAQTTEFLSSIPALVGSNERTDYLLILQNEAEMRSSGGLITAYGHLTIENGEIGEIMLSDSWNLENYVSYDLGTDVGYRNIYGQNVLMNLGCGSTYLRAQDSGIYPDLKWTMDTFKDYYDIANTYDKERFPDYDHVVIMNFAFAENILELIQPLDVEGFGQVTADTLFDFIKQDTDNPDLAYSADRKRIIEDIANAVKEKLFDLELSRSRDAINIIVDSFMAKDIALFSEDQNMQNYFEIYGMDGSSEKTFDGDYFQLNEAQNCSLKLNKFVRNSVTQDINIDQDGNISRVVRVDWVQDVVYNDSLILQYSPYDTFSYRAWIRLFTPIEVGGFESDGFYKSGYVYYYPQEYNDDVMNKAVSDNIIQFDHRRLTESDPVVQHDLNISYSLPEKFNYNLNNNNYKLLIQKHPGKSWGEEYRLTINDKGKTYTLEFVLDQDKIVTYSEGIITVDNYNKKMDWLKQLVADIPFEMLD